METQGRITLERQIADLEQKLLTMSTKADTMVGKAVEAIVTLDEDIAKEVLLLDDEIDALDLAIEADCLQVLALQQPMATDLREIGTIMKANADVERIGDLSVDIAKAAIKIEAEGGQTEFVDFAKMAEVARSMLRDSLAAFVKRDLELVAQVVKRDDEVDALYKTLRGHIHDRMRSNPEDVVATSWMLLAIHHVERIADHAVNIAERVSFMVTGKYENLAPSHLSNNPNA
jgi:phosphate transport system protein